VRPHRTITVMSVLCAGILLWIGVTSLADAYATARIALGKAGDTVIEAAEARVRALESLGATVAHEIRNPLSAVKGLVELLIESPDQGRARKRLDVVRGEVERVEKILDGYLSFARPWGELARVPTDVGALVGEVAVLLEAGAEREGIVIIAENAAMTIDADPGRLKEALLNLVLNALQATPAGGTVRIVCTPGPRAVSIVVDDTGGGLDAATLARLGNAFFTTRESGTGLGVLMARQVAELHGGTLTFTSTPGRGTKAILTIPHHRSQPDSVAIHADRSAV
jgi:two-component system, NtrC family, sensor histidine kinase HydH